MKRVWKFTLNMADEQIVKMPMGANLLSIQLQGGEMVMWALVDPLTPNVGHRMIQCYGTGSGLRSVGQHVATVQAGSLVYHFFDGGWV